MRTEVLARFIKLMALATFVMFSFWMGWQFMSPGVPGDYDVRQGGHRLAEGLFDEALESFGKALDETAEMTAKL